MRANFTCNYLVSLDCGHRILMRTFPFPRGKYICSLPGCTRKPQLWTEWKNLRHPEENRIFTNRAHP